jgi:Recombination endonuclease VII
MRIRPQATCHPDRPHFAKGLCKNCYAKPRRDALREKNKIEGKVYPSHTPEERRKSSLKYLGWSPELFDKVWKEQEGKCAICSKNMNLELVQNGARACADHVHIDPPKPRGILCTNCNAMIGQGQDNPETMTAAAAYLEKFLLDSPAEEVQTTTYPINPA